VLTASVAALMDSLHLSMLISESPNNIIHQTRCRRNGHQQGLMRAGDDGRWADQGLDMVVPPIDSGPVAFTHLHDACPT
jgi:hypothetical protein